MIMGCRALICASAVLLTVPAMAMADAARFNITAQPLPAALKAFADQAHMQVLYQYDAVSGATGNAVSGKLDKHAALEQLLKNTGLEAVYSSETAATIRPIRVKTTSQGAGAGAASAAVAYASSNPGTSSEQSIWERFRVAQADQAIAASTPQVSSSSSTASKNTSKSPVLEEVIVTAQKRDERLQDVPVPVTAISASTLLENNQVQLEDYASSVPGFQFSPVGSAGQAQAIAIRGISTGWVNNPTVGYTIDDVPFGSSGPDGATPPDLDPSDLARVEVLRGPQGTLYGASSMGGLIKFVTVDPSTKAFSGRVQATTEDVHNGAQIGYGLRAALNVPLSDTFAMRVSGFARQDPGYIDNPVLHIEGVNQQHVYGGRLAGLWHPSDTISFKFSALFQDTKGDGSNDVDTGLGDLQQNYARGIGAYRVRTQAYSAILNAQFTPTTQLTWLSGYNVQSVLDSLDASYLLGSLAQSIFGAQYSAVPAYTRGLDQKFTQELKLTTQFGEHLDWLGGLYYTFERAPSGTGQTLVAADPNTGQVAGTLLQVEQTQGKIGFQEFAGFTDFTYHFTNRFDVQIGGRLSHVHSTPALNITSGALQEPPSVSPGFESTSNPFTYLVTPRFAVSPDLMIYARFASGYRKGGSNGGVPDVPPEFGPDKTKNYEVGVKGDGLQHSFSYDASIYYIDWDGLQINVLNAGTPFTFTSNAGRAKSQGVELSTQANPLRGLILSAWVSWDEAVLTKDIPPSPSLYGKSGDRLPYSSRFSGYLSLDQDISLTDGITARIGGAVRYFSNAIGAFTDSSTRAEYPAYARSDVHAGLTYESWNMNLYCNNVTDRRAIVGGGPGVYPPFAYRVIQPRTIGLTLVRQF
jgi:outer membrane receptor protein involved in Fe transport